MAVLPTVLPSGGHAAAQRRIVLVFTCYLDDSGTHGSSGAIVCAGYVAPLEVWSKYERAATRIYRKDRITVFHAKEFNRRNGQFKGWTMIRQTAFIHDLLNAAKAIGSVGVTNAVHKERHTSAKKQFGADSQTSSYGRAFLGMLDRLQADVRFGPTVKSKGLSIVVEAGNKNDTNLVREFKRLQATTEYGWLKSISLVRKTDSHAVQLADFLAYYSWQYAEDWVRLNLAGSALTMPQMGVFLKFAKDEIRTIGSLADDFFVTRPSSSA